MHRTVIDEDLIIECIKESRQSELDAKDDENNNTHNSSSYNNNNNKATTTTLVNAGDDGDYDLLNGKLSSNDSKLVDNNGEIIDFVKIKQLSLSFRDIYKIDHLQTFVNLTELRLDNNLIETIENLSHLVNLKWLDLSFNNISKIEGLEELKNLTDLCLVNNFISKIEGLENCANLQVLSLGNNCIESIDDNILYLRQFKHLQALNLKGNPIYDQTEFKVSIFAFCDNLKFLDYERVKDADIIHAKNEKMIKLTEIKEEEAKIEQQLKQQQDEEEFNKLLEDANISGVNSLFDDMIRDDSEMIRLQNLPGFQGKMDEYKVQIEKYTKKYIESVIQIYDEKIKEDKILNKTLKKVCFESETYSIDIINKFENEELKSLDVEGIKVRLKAISDILMEAEMQCVEKVNFIINAVEDRITDLMKKNLNNAESYFAEIQNLENEYHQQLLDLIANILDQIKENGIDSVIDPLPENEALRNMIMDKEAINNSITLSHDNHISHIGRLEDSVRDREEKEKMKKMQKENDTQYKRNRQRISEILIFTEKYTKQFGIKLDE